MKKNIYTFTSNNMHDLGRIYRIIVNADDEESAVKLRNRFVKVYDFCNGADFDSSDGRTSKVRGCERVHLKYANLFWVTSSYEYDEHLSEHTSKPYHHFMSKYDHGCVLYIEAPLKCKRIQNEALSCLTSCMSFFCYKKEYEEIEDKYSYKYLVDLVMLNSAEIGELEHRNEANKQSYVTHS